MLTAILIFACFGGLYLLVQEQQKSDTGHSIERSLLEVDQRVIHNDLTFPVSERTTLAQLVRKGFDRSKPVLFLDIDGVLHPNTDESLSQLPLLLDMLERNPNLQIVMSSSWRADIDDNFIVNKFGIAFDLALVGATPYGLKSRSDEINAFVKYYKVDKYIILDDRKDLFKQDDDNIIFTQTHRGLTKQHVKLINEWLK